jgi:hypothetical protein
MEVEDCPAGFVGAGPVGEGQPQFEDLVQEDVEDVHLQPRGGSIGCAFL